MMRLSSLRFCFPLLFAGVFLVWFCDGSEQSCTFENDYPVISPKVSREDIPVKNIIYMIGDGMGFSHVFTAWAANKGKLYMNELPVAGMARSWCSDKLITDSAAAGTALATGVKTTKGTLGMTPEGKKVDSLIADARRMGKSTGIVVTCDITDATPAAFYSHVPNRKMAYEIASFLPDCGVDFIVGGGLSKLTERPDGRDILQELERKGYEIVLTQEGLKSSSKKRVAAILAPSHLPVPQERGDVLEDAVGKGLDILSRNEEGFFLMVEGSKIDKEAHKNNLNVMLDEIFDFDRAVGRALKWASEHPGTLVVVTADHNTGGLTLISGEKDKGKVVCHFSSMGHNEVAVPVFAYGAGARIFTGVYENTDIPLKIGEVMKKRGRNLVDGKKLVIGERVFKSGLKKRPQPVSQEL